MHMWSLSQYFYMWNINDDIELEAAFLPNGIYQCDKHWKNSARTSSLTFESQPVHHYNTMYVFKYPHNGK